MSNYWERYINCSLIFKKWHRFVVPEFVDSYLPLHGISPPPRYSLDLPFAWHCGWWRRALLLLLLLLLDGVGRS